MSFTAPEWQELYRAHAVELGCTDDPSPDPASDDGAPPEGHTPAADPEPAPHAGGAGSAVDPDPAPAAPAGAVRGWGAEVAAPAQLPPDPDPPLISTGDPDPAVAPAPERQPAAPARRGDLLDFLGGGA